MSEVKHVDVRLRVPPELQEKIQSSAKEHRRSMNADMVARLEKSFQIDSKVTAWTAEADFLPPNQSVDNSLLLEEIRLLRTESREMRQLYVDALNKKPTE